MNTEDEMKEGSTMENNQAWMKLFGHVFGGIIAKNGDPIFDDERLRLVERAKEITTAALASLVSSSSPTKEGVLAQPEAGDLPDAPELQRLRESTMEGYLRQYRELLGCEDTTDDAAIEEARRMKGNCECQEAVIAKLRGTASGLREMLQQFRRSVGNEDLSNEDALKMLAEERNCQRERLARFMSLLGCKYNTYEVAFSELEELVTNSRRPAPPASLDTELNLQRELDEAKNRFTELQQEHEKFVAAMGARVASSEVRAAEMDALVAEVRDRNLQLQVQLSEAHDAIGELRAEMESRAAEPCHVMINGGGIFSR